MPDQPLLQAGFRYALSLCHDRAEAKDLVQEAWLRLHSYPAITRGLLLRTIRNRWIDIKRRPRIVELQGHPDGVAAGAAPEHTRAELAAALAVLRPEEREAIYLSVVEGYTAAEIAELSDRSRNTVLSLIRRGKAKLREQLSDADADDDDGTAPATSEGAAQ